MNLHIINPPVINGDKNIIRAFYHLTYGSEIWSLTKALERKLQSAQRRMERIMLDITWGDRMRAS